MVGTPIYTPIYYSPYYWDPQKGTPYFGKNPISFGIHCRTPSALDLAFKVKPHMPSARNRISKPSSQNPFILHPDTSSAWDLFVLLLHDLVVFLQMRHFCGKTCACGSGRLLPLLACGLAPLGPPRPVNCSPPAMTLWKCRGGLCDPPAAQHAQGCLGVERTSLRCCTIIFGYLDPRPYSTLGLYWDNGKEN